MMLPVSDDGSLEPVSSSSELPTYFGCAGVLRSVFLSGVSIRGGAPSRNVGAAAATTFDVASASTRENSWSA